MEALSKLERTILGWLKNLPHLPVSVRQWLAENVWWFAVVGAVIIGIVALMLLTAFSSNLSDLSSPVRSYYASPAFLEWLIVKEIVAFVFAVLLFIPLAMAVNPLRQKVKKGWVLLFTTWLLGIISIVANSILTLNPFYFVTNIIFGAICMVVSGYLLFEIHDQFAHVERSKGTKAAK